MWYGISAFKGSYANTSFICNVMNASRQRYAPKMQRKQKNNINLCKSVSWELSPRNQCMMIASQQKELPVWFLPVSRPGQLSPQKASETPKKPQQQKTRKHPKCYAFIISPHLPCVCKPPEKEKLCWNIRPNYNISPTFGLSRVSRAIGMSAGTQNISPT